MSTVSLCGQNAAYEERLKANREARAKGGQQMAEEAAAAAAKVKKQALLRKLPRPTVMQRSETSMQLHMRRDKRDSPDAVVSSCPPGSCSTSPTCSAAHGSRPIDYHQSGGDELLADTATLQIHGHMLATGKCGCQHHVSASEDLTGRSNSKLPGAQMTLHALSCAPVQMNKPRFNTAACSPCTHAHE